MNVMEAIAARRSIRKYEDRPVEQEKIQKILESMRLAPSAGNGQKWKFFAVVDPAVIEKIGSVCLGTPDWIKTAPAILIGAGYGPGIMTCGHDTSSVDLTIPMSYASLEAVELGLGTCLIASYKQEDVCGILGLDDSWRIPLIATLGYGAEAPDARPRKDAAEVTQVI
ncbi:MAG: nitroreductase family protein [Lachnospiraceae bacterium]|nr:nitroreductase family protein [Lachnospiraceae bacterium]